jgi:xylulokinase
VPRVAAPREQVGETPDGIALAPGTGDNMAAALGLDLEPGDVVVSLGTSGTVFAMGDRPTADPSGIVAGFADATGGFLPLVCTLNAARVVGAALRMAGAELEDLDRLALSVDDTEGLVLLPFLDGERTPALPDATGLLHGLTRANATPAHLVRASVEGMLCGLSDAVDALDVAGVDPQRIVLIGGAARSTAVQQIAAGLFGLPVALPEPAEYVALGAARQAAWVLSGADNPPEWTRDVSVVQPDERFADYYGRVRASYTATLTGARPLLIG